MKKTIEYIVAATGATRWGTTPATIDRLLTDSRALTLPEGTLFFALRTGRGDGHRYINDLYKRGVRNFVVSTLPDDLEQMPQANFLQTPDTLEALQRLAENIRNESQATVIGITGSNGKTVVKEWLYRLLAPDHPNTIRSPRSYNSQTGVPLSIWLMDEQTQLAILEAGISQPGEMSRLSRMIRPDIGVLTNIGEAHRENFGSAQSLAHEKLELMKDCRLMVYCADRPIPEADRLPSTVKRLAWSRTNPESELYVSAVEKGEEETIVSYRWHTQEATYRLPMTDEASVENSLHCLAVALSLGMDTDTIARRMVTLEPVAMRLELKEGRGGCVLINDTYNADLNSLDIALNYMARRSQDRGRKRTLVMSDLMETGQVPESLYRRVAEMAERHGVERFVGVGRDIRWADRYLKMEKQFFLTTEELMASGLGENLKNEVVLIKGARSFGLDRLVERWEQKAHETILETDLGAMVENLNHYRSLLKPGVKTVCMVKASAYGAGAREVGKTLQDRGVDYLAVAVADEGAELRRAGVTADILVMNPELTALKTLLDHRLEPEVYSFRLLEALIQTVEKEGTGPLPIHIKLDTGMHRLGFAPQEMDTLIRRLKEQTAVVVRSVFSHLVGSDGAEFDDFTRRQIETFRQASDKLTAAFPHKILRHICNTAGIERYPEAQFDMVRLGLGLYGVDPFTNRMLHNVTTLRTTILQIHDVPREDTVGYSRRGQLKRDSRIAALPIGYADGLNRRLGNGAGWCLVNGQRAPYVGNICMDVCMIDVTDIDCKEGDTAIIFGKELPPTVLADILGTIPYEILTGVSTRVKRVYFQE